MILFISLFTIFSNLYLGLLVFIRNHKDATHRLFLLFTISVALWSVTNYFSLYADSPAEALFRIRLVLSAAVVMFSLLYFFAANFPASNWRLPARHWGIIAAFSLSIIVLVFTPLVFKGVSMQNGKIIPLPNIGMFFYSFSIIGLPLASSIVLMRKLRSAKGEEKERLKFLFLGITLTFILTTVTNFLLVNVFKFTSLVVLGPFFTLIFVAFSSYAILRHHLMNIKVILTEALVFLIALILLIDVFISQSAYQKLLRGGIFLVFFFFAYLLIKSVLNEIRQREEVERLAKAKSEFLSIASHQLRTPLTVIKGYISMIIDGTYGKTNENIKNIINKVYESNERLIKLIDDLLNISRLDAGTIELKPEEIFIDKIISEVVEELKIQVREKKIYLKFEAPKKPIKITADKEKIRQVILNIIDNAIKYTAEGGITIRSQIRDRKLQIIISDTGEGMSAEEMGKIFQIFSRGKAGSKFWARGTGLGLYTARKFVEMHHGKLWAVSEGKGSGSAFYIELPIK